MTRASRLKERDDIIARLSYIRTKKQEYLICFSFDSGQKLIARRVITIGLLDIVLAHPREIYAKPITDRAAYIIIAHNHPSGDPSPSKQDIKLTHNLIAAGQLLGIPLRDHIVITKEEYYSFRSDGIII